MGFPHFEINQIRIASPCNIGWESMGGDERVRFCGSCKLNVYNLSEMRADGIRSLIRSKEGRICAWLYKRPDGTLITKDCPLGIKAYRKKASRFAGAIFASVIGLFGIGFGQSGKDTNQESKIERSQSINESGRIVGLVTDEQGAIIPGVRIVLKDNKNGKKIKISSDSEGSFGFPKVAEGIYRLEFYSKGFESHVIKKLSIRKNEDLNISIKLEPSGHTAMIGVVAEESMIDTTSSSITHTIKPPQN
jgi:hypothetical protein